MSKQGRSGRWQELVLCGRQIQTFLFSVATVLAQSPLLREHNMEAGMPAEPRVVARISLIGGATTAPFNLLVCDILLRLMGHVIAVAEQPSDSLDGFMARRMGLSFSLYRTEPALVRCCCGDDNTVTEGIAVVYLR
ncbi:hypothetical protein TcCL_NonESM06970 [Trypanosoma cruzi]|nr:hypothetical protein TcCL_NonESM06970 [Trypanosoma cruzi]